MNITLKAITKDEKLQLKKMLLEYFKEIDTSKIIQNPTNESLDYPYLDNYWTDSDRMAVVILLKNEKIGFVLVNAWTICKEFNADKSIAEFYIQPQYRRKGIGKWVAQELFNQYKVKWEVKQSSNNLRAIQFWRNTISTFSNGNFQEKTLLKDKEAIVLQLFESK
jgi:predicted acetyltransferase